MTINQTRDDDALTISLEGRLDTTTAPVLEASLNESLTGVESLVLDLKDLAYLSSAGLRVILTTQKKMAKKKMVIHNVNETIMEVFEVTGFTDILTIE